MPGGAGRGGRRAIGIGVAVIVAASGGCGGGTGEAGAGEIPLVELGEPEAAYAESFAAVQTVRELEDGRVLVADPLGQVVVRVDLDAGTADTIGSVGEGPDEYIQPDAVWPLPGGRTLLVDLGNGRLTELSADLEFGETRPYAMGDVTRGQLVMALPHAVDDRGRLYFRDLSGMGSGSDSAKVFRLDLETEALDSVGRVKLPDVTRQESGGPNNQNVQVTQVPLSPADAWGVAGDGRLVVARAGDYHVDWIAGDGSVTSGPPIPYEPVGIGMAEKRQWRDGRSESGGGLGMEVGIANGTVSVRVSRGGASRDDDEALEGYPWPEVKPAFYGGTVPVLVDGSGRAWVRRHREAGELPRYDLFGSSGEREMTVELTMRRRVVSFGEAALYAVYMDGYGRQFLERYRLP